MDIKRFKVTITYDGTNYNGWQRQNNGIGIQEIIEKTLKKITKQDIEIIGSGRTDKHVHAYGQVFHFDTTIDMDANNFLYALNGLLPDDIYVKNIIEVDNNFHARFSAIKKTYIYKINIGEYDPLLYNYVYYQKNKLNINLMKKCSKIFIGEHDFSAFCSNSFDIHPDQTREIYQINFILKDNILEIEYVGNGFLRYMVRMISACLIQVGNNKLSIKEVKDILETKDKESFKFNAIANGLYLKEVLYSND